MVAIRNAVEELIAADAKRGLVSSLIALDDAAAMKKFAAIAVVDPGNPKHETEFLFPRFYLTTVMSRLVVL